MQTAVAILILVLIFEIVAVAIFGYRTLKSLQSELKLVTEWLNKPDGDYTERLDDIRNVTYLLYRESLVEQLSKMRYYLLKALDEENYESLNALKTRYESVRKELRSVFDVDISESADDVVRSHRNRH